MTEPISWGKFLLWQKRFFFGGGFTAQGQPFDFFLNLVIISGIISDGAQYGKMAMLEFLIKNCVMLKMG